MPTKIEHAERQIDHGKWQLGYDEGKRWCEQQIALKRYRRIVNGCAEYEQITTFTDGFYAAIRDFLMDVMTTHYLRRDENHERRTGPDQGGDERAG